MNSKPRTPSLPTQLHRRATHGQALSKESVKQLVYDRYREEYVELDRLRTAQQEAYFGTGTMSEVTRLQEKIDETDARKTKYLQLLQALR